MQITKFKFPVQYDSSGKQVSYESKIPFDIKRVYYMYGTLGGIRRGKHAHRTLNQVLVCIYGSCKIFLDDGLESQEIVELNSPDEGLLVPKKIWHEMFDFKPTADDFYREHLTFEEELNGERNRLAEILNPLESVNGKKIGGILLVFASDFYDESDYLRNYDQFLKFIQEGV